MYKVVELEGKFLVVNTITNQVIAEFEFKIDAVRYIAANP